MPMRVLAEYITEEPLDITVVWQLYLGFPEFDFGEIFPAAGKIKKFYMEIEMG
jgi:hypothetical protein